MSNKTPRNGIDVDNSNFEKANRLDTNAVPAIPIENTNGYVDRLMKWGVETRGGLPCQ